MINLLLLLLLPALWQAASTPTECNQQLHNYYLALGIPIMTPVYPALVFTSGVYLGQNYVQIENRIQEAARYYDTLLPSPPGNLSWCNYLTVDIPWCVTDIQWSCYSNATFGMAKTTNCTTLPDYDLGAPSIIAGRLFMYPQQPMAPCNGSAFVTFFNVTLPGGGDNNTYTYDIRGIQYQQLMSWQVAAGYYRTSTCAFSDGNPADVATQAQFVCIEPGMFCAGTRPPGGASIRAIPYPELACIGYANANSSVQTVIWKVSSLQPPGGLEGQYGATFVSDLSFAVGAEYAYLYAGQFYILISNSVRQFDSHINSLSQYGLFYYEGQWTNFQPIYALSSNPQFAAVPCACGFSMFCDSLGNADVASPYVGFVRANNALPICNPGPDQQIPFGTPFAYFSANASFDPDNAPYSHTTYWIILSTPYDPNPPPFTIEFPMQSDQTLNLTGLVQGSYYFGLYSSDLQAQVPCTLNITIIPNVVTAIVENDKIVAFTFYSGQQIGHPCTEYPPDPAIPLNGSYSFGTDPSIPLYYEWIITAQGALQVPFYCDPTGFISTSAFFNTTEPIAYFVPPIPGTYCFQLSVTDGITNSTSAQLCVTVTPNFGQPPSSFTPIFNFTPPPIRDFNFTNRTIFSPPPSVQAPFYTLAPIQASPNQSPPPLSGNTTPIFPPVPELTFGDKLVLYVILACIVAFYIFFVVMVMLYSDDSGYRNYEKQLWGGAYNRY